MELSGSPVTGLQAINLPRPTGFFWNLSGSQLEQVGTAGTQSCWQS